MNYAVFQPNLKLFPTALKRSVYPYGKPEIGRSAPKRVDAVTRPEKWTVLQNMVEPSLQICNVTKEQGLPRGGSVAWDVVTLGSGVWECGVNATSAVAAET